MAFPSCRWLSHFAFPQWLQSPGLYQVPSACIICVATEGHRRGKTSLPLEIQSLLGDAGPLNGSGKRIPGQSLGVEWGERLLWLTQCGADGK